MAEITNAVEVPLLDTYEGKRWETIGGSTSLYFLMRGYRPGTADFETWTAVGAPNSTNPSGQPIVDVTVVAKWTA